MRQGKGIEEFFAYLNGVIGRCEHHRQDLLPVIDSLIPAVVRYADAKSLRWRTNALWFRTVESCERYCMSYNRRKKRIEVKYKSQKGAPVLIFDGESDVANVLPMFCLL